MNRLTSRFLVLLATALSVFTGCAEGPAPPTSPISLAQRGETALPRPRLTGDMALEEAMANRRSVRSFTDEPLSWQEISQLLWSAQGITDSRGLRTAPSAGALYPLEVYVVLPDGVYHYRPQGHVTESVSDQDARQDLWEAGLQQEALRQAPAIFVFVAVYERTEVKYGERAERYVELEAGHAAQNLLLQAVVLNLGAVPIGAFHDDQVQAALLLPPDHRPLYLIPVGHPSD